MTIQLQATQTGTEDRYEQRFPIYHISPCSLLGTGTSASVTQFVCALTNAALYLCLHERLSEQRSGEMWTFTNPWRAMNCYHTGGLLSVPYILFTYTCSFRLSSDHSHSISFSSSRFISALSHTLSLLPHLPRSPTVNCLCSASPLIRQVSPATQA